MLFIVNNVKIPSNWKSFLRKLAMNATKSHVSSNKNDEHDTCATYMCIYSYEKERKKERRGI